MAVSIKMNVLLFLPAHLLLLLQSQPLSVVGGQWWADGWRCRLLLALPFVLHDADAYVSKAFEFSRVFLYKWTVNLRFLPEPLFLHPLTARLLLAAHFIVLLYVLNRYAKGGLIAVVQRALSAVPSMLSRSGGTAMYEQPSAMYAVSLYFICNFVGIVLCTLTALPVLLLVRPHPPTTRTYLSRTLPTTTRHGTVRVAGSGGQVLRVVGCGGVLECVPGDVVVEWAVGAVPRVAVVGHTAARSCRAGVV